MIRLRPDLARLGKCLSVYLPELGITVRNVTLSLALLLSVCVAVTPVPTLHARSRPVVQAAPNAQVAVEVVPVGGGFSSPLYVTHAGDGSGRLFIVERTGTIRILINGATHPTPFLDISAL